MTEHKDTHASPHKNSPHQSNTASVKPDTPAQTSGRPRYLPPEPKAKSKVQLKDWFNLEALLHFFNPPPDVEEKQLARDSLFSIQGRLGRLSVMAANLGLMVMILLWSCFITIGINPIQNHQLTIGFGGIVLLLLPLLLILGYSLLLFARRLHDLDIKGFWVLLPIAITLLSAFAEVGGLHAISKMIMLINILLMIYVCIAPGSPRVNRFGPPRYTPTYEKIMGWIYAGLMLLQVLIGSMLPDPRAAKPDSPTKKAIPVRPAKVYAPPYPFTAQELWGKLLKLTAQSNGHLSAAFVGQTLDAQIQPVESPLSATSYAAQAGIDWYFMVRINPIKMIGQNMQVLMFSWDNTTDPIGAKPPAELCIPLTQFKPDLLAQGWQVKDRVALPSEPKSDSAIKLVFDKGGITSLSVSYNAQSTCLTQLTLMAAVTGGS